MAQSKLEMNNSSSDDEEVSTGVSESELESDMTPPPQPSSRKTHATPQLSSEESESDADSPPKKFEKADPNIKPLASKPMDDEPSKKPRPKNPISRNSPPPTKPVNGKRKAAEVEDEAMETKITKKEVVAPAPPGPENAAEKKPLFQRLWSEDDEIVLIKGMISYVETKGKDPIADVNDFHEFVKTSLNVDVNNGQMTAKVKRLKAKFMNNVGKIEQNGKVRSLSNPHEKKMYELSEKLWDRNSIKNAAIVGCNTKKVNPKPKPDQKLKANSNPVVSNGGHESGKNVVHSRGGIKIPITDEDIMNRGLELLSGPKKVELEEKWNDLKVQELKNYLRKLELMKEQGELVLNAMKKSCAS
ncbi:unnamed protein product [Lactuca virosa]|uniref:Glabrous enhancer-binding protein-like DBD domain-containing protein n=1 Tax=Lactuca virosa TaxID=75947 RepID=A0AAU9NQG4_9ASTR|nr:unnamed protein product [Lactuca virosa]